MTKRKENKLAGPPAYVIYDNDVGGWLSFESAETFRSDNPETKIVSDYYRATIVKTKEERHIIDSYLNLYPERFEKETLFNPEGE